MDFMQEKKNCKEDIWELEPSCRKLVQYRRSFIIEKVTKIGLNGNVQQRMVKNEKEKVKVAEYNLYPIEREDLKEKKREGKDMYGTYYPLLVIKKEGKLYYSLEIPRNIAFFEGSLEISEKRFHLCARCKRFSPLCEEEGGCSKIRDNSRHIEDYPFITDGYETFGSSHSQMVILRCEHYEKKVHENLKVTKVEIPKVKFNSAVESSEESNESEKSDFFKKY